MYVMYRATCGGINRAPEENLFAYACSGLLPPIKQIPQLRKPTLQSGSATGNIFYFFQFSIFSFSSKDGTHSHRSRCSEHPTIATHAIRVQARLLAGRAGIYVKVGFLRSYHIPGLEHRRDNSPSCYRLGGAWLSVRTKKGHAPLASKVLLAIFQNHAHNLLSSPECLQRMFASLYVWLHVLVRTFPEI